MKTKPLIGSWEETFHNKLTSFTSNDTTIYKLFHVSLKHKQRRGADNELVSDKRGFDAIRNEVVLAETNFLEERLDDEYSGSTKAISLLKKLDATATDRELKECQRIICGDLSLRDLVMEYKEATEVESLRKLNTRQFLKELALKDKDSGHFHCLITSLTRIVAAKPHSADVERLICVYNKLKSNDRASFSPGTIKNYLHVSQTWVIWKLLTHRKQPLIGSEQKAEEKGCQKKQSNKNGFWAFIKKSPLSKNKKNLDKSDM